MALAAGTRTVLLVVVLTVLGLATGGVAQLKNGFYTGKCGANNVETIVQGLVKARVARDAAIVAQLLRLQFHECAINGCDAGLLVDGPGTEKTAKPNLSVKGYDLIAAIKTELEKRCPGVVSCSDIEILATRDAVSLAGGQRYAVRTGRRDRRRSSATDVKLPSEEDKAAQAAAYFGSLGFTELEMVVLLGAHTVGVTHCSKIKKTRLYSYGGKANSTDPSLDPSDMAVYKKFVCPNMASSDNNILYLDTQSSVSRIDNSYYKRLQGRHGVLSVDQNLYANGASTKRHVDNLANNVIDFSSLFPKALIKLSELKVLTGMQGEVRKVCSRFN
ncbi:peroxidase 57-like [Lolium rigidum]|uniref:peroxidase 57-like n=1 Tax=Lolium rigidum TaxID=89674 RepID=UPI001F5CAE94|nr:peroxidase 57-like [Lolium rigidum]